MTEAYDGRQVVGMDLHRRRSVLVRMTMDGRKLETEQPAGAAGRDRQGGEEPAGGAGGHVRLVLGGRCAGGHLAHPLGTKAFSYRRVKNDERDAADLADLLRMGRLPEAWIAPAEIRALREVVRYRHKLVGQRTSCKDQVHAVLAKCGVAVRHSDIFGRQGSAWLDQLMLPQPYAAKMASLRALAGVLDGEITRLGQQAAGMLDGHPGYAAIRELPGIGPVLGAVIVAEIGDVSRFRKPGQLCSWAGLTPRHYESDTRVIRGHVSKQGSRMLRWALVEAIQRQPAGTRPREVKDAIIARRGKEARDIAKVAAARQMLTLVFYGLRDGHIRRAISPAA